MTTKREDYGKFKPHIRMGRYWFKQSKATWVSIDSRGFYPERYSSPRPWNNPWRIWIDGDLLYMKAENWVKRKNEEQNSETR